MLDPEIRSLKGPGLNCTTSLDRRRDALLAPADGIAALALSEAGTGRYVIPSEPDCRACHEGPVGAIYGQRHWPFSYLSPRQAEVTSPNWPRLKL